jgi:hypothetical protein
LEKKGKKSHFVDEKVKKLEREAKLMGCHTEEGRILVGLNG